MKRLMVCSVSIVLGVALSLVGCEEAKRTPDKKEPVATRTAPQRAAPVSTVSATQLFAERCAMCHGATGKGDGAAAATYNPKPRDYTDKAWQASVTDEQIKKTILYGGAGVGKSPIMPSSPDLDGKPEVLDGLVKIVRGFGGA